MQASALLLRWGCYCWAHNLWVLIIYLFFLLVMLPSEIPKLPTDPLVRGFLVLGNFSSLQLPPQDGSPSLILMSLFLLLYFVLLLLLSRFSRVRLCATP